MMSTAVMERGLLGSTTVKAQMLLMVLIMLLMMIAVAVVMMVMGVLIMIMKTLDFQFNTGPYI